jgi:predicted cupin superfamily sugar epimerase
MHRVASDEIFHFYLGDPVEILQLFADSTGKIFTMGSNILDGNCVQILVSRQTWQGMILKNGGRFALLGTTVVPSFEFDDFEIGKREKLIEQYPGFRDQIINLTN